MINLNEIFNMDMNKLRYKIYLKYSRKEVANKLDLSEIQISRLLNGKSIISYKQFLILKDMIK